MLSNLWSLFIPLFVLSLSLPVLTIPTNVTIDDTEGDERTNVVPVYSPSNAWNLANECPSCVAQPDPAQVKDGTWHDTSTFIGNNASVTVEINFTGTAAYAYFVIMGFLNDAVTLTNLSFSMDGNDAGTFVHIPETSDPAYQYNVNGFAKTNLENTSHTLTITNNGFFDGSLVLFDYLVYTSEDDAESVTATDTSSTSTSTSVSTTPSPTKSIDAGSSSDASNSRTHNLGAIVGGVVGCVMAILLAISLFLYCRHRRRQHYDSGVKEPFDVPPYYQPVEPYPRAAATEGSIGEGRGHNTAVSQSFSGKGPGTGRVITHSPELENTLVNTQETGSDSGTRSNGNARDVLSRIEALQVEVDRLQLQQRLQNSGNINDPSRNDRTEPPPVYDAR